MRRSLCIGAIAVGFGLGSCAVDDKGTESYVSGDDLEAEGKDDSFRSPTYVGPLAWDEPNLSEITATEQYLAWTFELSAEAQVELTTGYAVRGQRRVDTVLYLYKEGPTGWGANIARNDDYGSTVYSQLSRNLGPGRYRALVKGYASSTRGRFKLVGTCEGAGCAPAVASCLFGETYRDLFDQPGLVIDNQNEITATTLDRLGPDDQQRLVVAVQQSSHTDVTTPLEAIGRVDQGLVNVTWFRDATGRRSFIAFEYGAGDNSYGAIFDRITGVLEARIGDGDLGGCSITAETCILPPDVSRLRTDPRFQRLETLAITSAAGLAPIVQDQVLDAMRRRYGALVTTVADGLALADGGTINHERYLLADPFTELHVVEWGAGDTSVGMIYFADSLQIAGAISDLDIDGCGVFAVTRQSGEGDTCRGTGGCTAGLACFGVFAGAGVCVANGELPTGGNECDRDEVCGLGGICAGATRGYGLCGPAWHRGTFTDATPTAIPDGGVLVERIPVRGLATVDTDVELALRIDHPRASQLQVILENPGGTAVVVHAGTAGDDGAPLVIAGPITTGFSGDESVNGEWRLRITDRATGHVGALTSFALTITSRWD